MNINPSLLAIFLVVCGGKAASALELNSLPQPFVHQYNYATESIDRYEELLTKGGPTDQILSAQRLARAASSQLQFLYDPLIVGIPTIGYPITPPPTSRQSAILANSLVAQTLARVDILDTYSVKNLQLSDTIKIPLIGTLYSFSDTPSNTYEFFNEQTFEMRAYVDGVELPGSPFPGNSSFSVQIDKPTTFQAFSSSATVTIYFASAQDGSTFIDYVSPFASYAYVFFSPDDKQFFINYPIGCSEAISFDSITTPATSSEFLFYNNTPEPISISIGSNTLLLEAGAECPVPRGVVGNLPYADGDKITGSNTRVTLDFVIGISGSNVSVTNDGTSSGVFYCPATAFYLQ